MAGETGSIAEMASLVAKDVFKWFKWEYISLLDQNFDCIKKEKHAPKKTSKHTHPVDIVFTYIDPYLNRRIMFNTDLKSYARSSIDSVKIRSALKSLAHTIDCARSSEEWRGRYEYEGQSSDVRALLFTYNHDGIYDGDFYQLFERKKSTIDGKKEKTITTETLPLESDTYIHIIEPQLISYMTTLQTDVRRLISEGSFPRVNYQFYYPELKLHKTSGDKFARPATIEMISGPFLIVEHDTVFVTDEISGERNQSFAAGYVIFYNKPGATAEEFMYLFDILSNYQILDRNMIIRIRVLHQKPHRDIRSNFIRAIERYIAEWGFDEYKKNQLEALNLHLVEFQRTVFSSVEIGWERK